MKKIRIIARLDVKGPNVIKGVNFECLRVMGNPRELAEKYYLQGADELIYIDTVASLYGRQNLLDIVNSTSNNIFIPFTVGGGVRTIDDIRSLLKAGADKVAINTAATKNPSLIAKSAKIFGSQCIVVSIEAKKTQENKWEAYRDNGREKTALDAIKWAQKAEKLGAGEILITSVDKEGTESGYDLELIKKISQVVSIPVIASGGAGKIEDFISCAKIGNIDGLAAASLLHYNKITIGEIKDALSKHAIGIRNVAYKKTKSNPANKYDSDNYNKFTLKHMKQLDAEQQKIKSKKNEAMIQDISKADIGIIDYGINNLKSISKAFEKIGKTSKIIDTPQDVMAAKCLVLPGIGAFGDAMKELKRKKLEDPIKIKITQGTPLLGICLGMQLLFSESEEFGLHKGLDLIKGRVIRLRAPKKDEIGYKVPHIGWNKLRVPSFSRNKSVWKNSLLKNIKEQSEVYFVHSYYPIPAEPQVVIATTEYGNLEFCCVIKKDNVSATQFHPEKSGESGLRILKEFCSQHKI